MTESNDFGFSETANEIWNNLSSENFCEGNLENFEFCGNSILKGTGLLDRLLSAKTKTKTKTDSHSSTQCITFRQCDLSFQ